MRNLLRYLTATVVLAVSLVVTLSDSAPANGAINKQVNFQGRLADSNGNVVGDGDYNVEFKLMTAASGGDVTQGSCTTDCAWIETRTGASKVTVSRGLFAIQLGEVSSLGSFDFNRDLYLSVRIGGTGTPSWDPEMSPRHRMGAAPTAIHADNAAQLNGNTAGNGSGQIALNNGTLNSNLNADLLDGQTGGFYQNASNITSGTLADGQLSANVALENTANVFSQSQTISNGGGKTTLALSNTGSDTGLTLGGDTNLYRSAANTLATDDNFQTAGSLWANQGSAASILLNTDGVVYFGSGFDVALGRGGTDLLNTADAFRTTFGGGKTTLQLASTGAETGLTIGGDTTLYRSAADTLSTDSHLVLSGDANQGISGGGLTDCDNATASKLLWDATTNKFSCGADQGGGGTSTLQQAYDATNGNTLTTTSARDVDITLADSATDSNFLVDIATGSTSRFAVQKNNVDMFGINPTGDVAVKGTVDSTTALLFEDKDGNDLLEIDTTNDQVQIGDATPDANARLLVLDSKNTDGDPSLVDGAMYYNSSTGNFRCKQNSSEWKDCDVPTLRENWFFYEDFTTATVTAGTGADLGNIGEKNWTFASVGTGGTITRIDVGALAADRDKFGVIGLNSPATANTGGILRQDNASINGVPADLTVEFAFASTTDNIQQIIRIGLHDQTSATAPVDGIYFQYNVTTGAGNWFRCTRNNNAETCTDTGIAKAATGTYERFKFVTNSAGTQVDFFIGEASAGSNTTNLPATARSYGPGIYWQTVDAVANVWKMDYFQLRRTDVTR